MNQIKLDDFLDYKYISNFKSNVNQTQALFTVGKAHLDKNEYHYDLYLLNRDRTRKLISLKKDSAYIWINEDEILVSLKKTKADEKKAKDKYSIFYKYNLQTKGIEKAFELPIPASVIKYLGKHKYLVQAQLSSFEHHLYLDPKENRKDLLKEMKQKALYEDINEIPFYGNGLGFTANKRQQLFIYDEEKDNLDLIVDPDFNVGRVVVSDDLKHIYYTGKQAKQVKSLTTHIYVYHMDTKITEILYHEDEYSISQLFILNDKIIVAASDMKTYGINQDDHFYELKDKKLVLYQTYGLSMSTSIGADVRLGANKQSLVHKGNIYFVKTEDDHTNLMVLNKDRNIETVYEMNGSIDGIEMIDDDIYIVGLHRQKLHEIYKYQLGKIRQLSRLNQKVMKDKFVSKPKTLVYKTKIHEVKGFVLYPKDFNPNKRYPAILDIHGGPKTAYGKVFYHEMQYWANQGYFVCYANPRGSDGKGDAFADIRGKYGTIDYEDLMNFTDLVIKKIPQINLDEFFVTGGSYGGFMTNWIVGHTDRFKAAATQRSIANWLSFHGTSDIGFYFSKDQTAGHPNINTEKLWEQSPMKYALNVKTPLLFIHSDEDYRCPIEQAMQFYSILKEKGVDTKFIWFKGETHELSRSGKPQARIKRLKEITDWFESHKS
jgi:dipeptidyl aminopeptidase/acylaminoacyl peptidase